MEIKRPLDFSELSRLWNEISQGRLAFQNAQNLGEKRSSELSEVLSHWRELGFTEVFAQRFLASVPVDPNDAWLISRQALTSAIEEALSKGSAPKSLHASLTHHGLNALVITCDLPSILGIGVDLESSERKVRPQTAKKFIQASEEKFLLKPIEIWVIKEACFKAYPGNLGLVMSDCEILEVHAKGLNRWLGVVRMKHSQISFHLISASDFTVSFALIKAQAAPSLSS